jgi:hypothetical protein
MGRTREQVEQIRQRLGDTAPSEGPKQFTETLVQQFNALWEAVGALADALDGLELP